MNIRLVCITATACAALCAGLTQPAFAQARTVTPVAGQSNVAPLPRLKPAPQNLSEILTSADAMQLRRGLSAARRGDWRTLIGARNAIQDPTAKNLLLWHRAARDPNVSDGWLNAAVTGLPDWPRMVSIRAKAEGRLFDDPLPPQQTIDWFQGREPVSGEGRAVLADAYYALGDRATGDRWLKSAWREARLTRDRQRKIFQRHNTRLNAQDHAARADHLIWLGRSHFSKAQALLPHMSNSDRVVMNARMRLASNRGVQSAVNAVPQSRAGDPGFLYERARWRRRQRSQEYALPLYLEIDEPAGTERGRERTWTEKRLMANWSIAQKNWPNAYNLTLNLGAESGPAFYESEFMGGWLALTKLNDPQRAVQHFQRLEAGVTSPISLARAHYWDGRALEALGDGMAARASYDKAALYPNTYYGQLAASRALGDVARLTLPPQIVSPTERQRFDADPRIKALRLIGEAGDERLFATFSYAMDDLLPSLDQLALLSQLAADYGQMRPSIRAAKQSGRFQSMLTEAGYPIIDPIERLDPRLFDIPFVYAIARQESEFSANAVSSASAMGMMQMINATARATARRHNIRYDRDRLITDRDYGAMLGALHLNDLLEDYDGSYIMAAVAYNAGPRRVRQWIERNGDPRTGQIDPIDWVEKIPFSETRNYVMRVMENMQVYEARRNGNVAPVTIDDKLKFGNRARRG